MISEHRLPTETCFFDGLLMGGQLAYCEERSDDKLTEFKSAEVHKCMSV